MVRLHTPHTCNSSRQSESLSKASISELPPEIWHIILRFAVGPDPEFHLGRRFYSLVDHFFEPDVHMIKNRVDETTKTSLMRVCRSWYSATTPFMYERILLNGEHDLRDLSAALASRSYAPARYIRTLYTDFVDVSSKSWQLLVTLLKHATGLRVYDMGQYRTWGSFVPPDGFRDLAPAVPAQLRSLTLCVTHPSVEVLELIASCGPSLQVLRIGCSVSFGGPLPSDEVEVSLPELHTICILGGVTEPILTVLSRWRTPKLSCIRGLGSISHFPIPPPNAHGPGITQPRIRAVAFTGPRYCSNFDEAFPEVEDLVFDVRCAYGNPIMIQQPVPHCQRVAMIIDREIHEAQRSQLAHTKDQFIPLGNPVTFPRLRLVRIVLMPSVSRQLAGGYRRLVWKPPTSTSLFDHARNRVFWVYWKRLWASRGVKLEVIRDGVAELLPDMSEMDLDADTLSAKYNAVWEESFVRDESDKDEDPPTALAAIFGDSD